MAETNLEHLKNSLAQITHFPWYWQENEDTWQLFGGEHGHMQIIKAPKRNTNYAEYWPNTHDSYVISNAPAWIASLITTIESQQQSFDKQVEGHKYTAGRYSDEMKETKRLNILVESQKEEIDRLRTALRIFADQKNWSTKYEMFAEYYAWVPYPMEEAPYLFVEKVLSTTSDTLQEGDK